MNTIALQAEETNTDFVLFRFFWVFFFVLMVVNPGPNFGLGNTNPFERFVLFIAALFYLKNKKIDAPVVLSVIGLFLVTLISAIGTTYYGFQWTRYGSAWFAFFVITMFFYVEPSKEQANLMLITLAVVPITMILLNFVYVGLGIRHFWMVDHTGAKRLGATVVVAFLAHAGMVGSIASAYLSTKRGKVFYLLLMLNLIITFLTATRTPTIIAFTLSSAILFIGFKWNLSRIGALLLGPPILALLLFYFGDNFIKRIESGSSSGREDMWPILLRWSDRYPEFGVGLGHHGLLIPDSLSDILGTKAAHSEYIRMWVELGHYGSVLYWFIFALFLYFFQRSIKGLDKLIFWLASILFLLFAGTDNAFFLVNGLFMLLAVKLGVEVGLNQGEMAKNEFKN